MSGLLTRTVRDFAVAHGTVSRPGSERHVHTSPTPRLGGVAIFATVSVIGAGFAFGAQRLGIMPPIASITLLQYLAPAAVIFGLGLWDDLRGVNAYLKFGVQAFAAVVLWAEGIRIVRVPIAFGDVELTHAVSLVATVMWVVWVTNAFNLIDGLDGLAVGSALFSTLVICVMALVAGKTAIAFLTIALAGAIAGFLRYNFNPATIFLGDCGSLFIGFMLSAVAISGLQKSPTLVAIAIPIVSLGLPILDVAVAVLRRFLSRKPIFSADREHIHHKLLSRGLSHRQTVLVLYAVTATFGLLSLLLVAPGGRLVGLVLAVIGLGVFAGLQQLRYHEIEELGRVASRTLHQREIVANNLAIRRAIDDLKKCGTAASLCAVVQQTLEPIGFSGVSIQTRTSSFRYGDVAPLIPTSNGELVLFWDPHCHGDESLWTLTLRVDKRESSVACLTVHRMTPNRPLLMDLNMFTMCGFADAVAEAMDHVDSDVFPAVLLRAASAD